jgi:hypothetical protein
MGTLESCLGAPPCYSIYVVYSMGTLKSCPGAPHAILCMLCTAWVRWKVAQGPHAILCMLCTAWGHWKVAQGPPMLFYVCCVQHGYAGKLSRGPSCYFMYVVYSMGMLESCPGAPHAILCMLCTAWVRWKVAQGPPMLFYVCCVQHVFLMFKHWFCWKYPSNKYMLNSTWEYTFSIGLLI